MGKSRNVEGAYLEVVADMLGSIGVIIAGVVMGLTDWCYADLIVSIVIGFFVIPRTYHLVRSAVDILMEGTPAEMDLAAIEAAIVAPPAVASVHDLHCWSISSGIVALSAHVRVSTNADSDRVLSDLKVLLDEQFGIEQTTIQVERTAFAEEIYHDLELERG